jgi:hypothetical protein
VERLLADDLHIGHIEWVGEQFERVPPALRVQVARRYLERYQVKFKEANEYLRRVLEVLPVQGASELDCEEAAIRAARECSETCVGSDDEAALKALSAVADRIGAPPPSPDLDKPDGRTVAGCCARLRSWHWWRRALRRARGRALEAAAREAELVGVGSGIYSSDETVQIRAAQRKRNRAFLEAMQAVNEDGDLYSLADLADLGQGNPSLRRAELMTRIAGFEEVANQRGDKGLFITLTAPSRMHRAIKRDGRAYPNPSWDGSDPRQVQAYLGVVWARARAALARADAEVYGIRVAEPHHDGCPHWHMLVFAPPSKIDEAFKIIRRYGLEEDPGEPGASEHRVTSIPIDKSKGSAAGYVAKYVAKNIAAFDGGSTLGAEFKHEGGPTGIERVDAWAACWGIRQFQFVGGPPVGVYRELRKLDHECDGKLEECRAAADAGDWAGFVESMGGPLCPRSDRPVHTVRMQDVDPVSGAIALNCYGEIAPAVTIGVSMGLDLVVTRLRSWVVSLAPSLPSPLEFCKQLYSSGSLFFPTAQLGIGAEGAALAGFGVPPGADGVELWL